MTRAKKRTVPEREPSRAMTVRNDKELLDLVLCEPIVDMDEILTDDMIRQHFHVNTGEIPNIRILLNKYFFDNFSYINPAYVEFIRDIQTIGCKAKFINDFWGWAPVTHILYKESCRSAYLEILNKYELGLSRIHLNITFKLFDTDFDDDEDDD